MAYFILFLNKIQAFLCMKNGKNFIFLIYVAAWDDEDKDFILALGAQLIMNVKSQISRFEVN